MRRSKPSSPSAVFVLLLAFLLLSGVLFLRVRAVDRSGPDIEEREEPDEAEDPDGLTLTAAEPTSSPRMAEEPAPAPPTELPMPENSAPETPAIQAPRGYTAQTYQLVSDMIYIRRRGMTETEDQIPGLLERLREADPALGETWTGIMEYWAYANSEMPICRDRLPDDLPQDDSLCLVVLGFQLLYDGDMAPELLGRCRVALECARQYPNAWIAVTGGGTAGKDKSITEAGVMADWLISQGIAPERVIREEYSLTTDQNATNTCAILTERYPQVKSVAVISSDYHLPLGCTMFNEAALLYGYEHGKVPFSVSANAAYTTDGLTPGYTGMQNQASYVWIMANPHY